MNDESRGVALALLTMAQPAAESGKGSREETTPREDSMLTFPQMLMNCLEDPRISHIIAWLDHGKAFIIKDEKAFCKEVLPKYFGKATLFRSFKRKLNRWGFRIQDRGMETGIYKHPSFIRGGHKHLHDIKSQNGDHQGSPKSRSGGSAHPSEVNLNGEPAGNHAPSVTSPYPRVVELHPAAHDLSPSVSKLLAALNGSNAGAQHSLSEMLLLLQQQQQQQSGSGDKQKEVMSSLQATSSQHDAAICTKNSTLRRPQGDGANQKVAANGGLRKGLADLASATSNNSENNEHEKEIRALRKPSKEDALFGEIFAKEFHRLLLLQQEQQQRQKAKVNQEQGAHFAAASLAASAVQVPAMGRQDYVSSMLLMQRMLTNPQGFQPASTGASSAASNTSASDPATILWWATYLQLWAQQQQSISTTVTNNELVPYLELPPPAATSLRATAIANILPRPTAPSQD